MRLLKLATAFLIWLALASPSLAGTVNGYTFATPIASSFCTVSPVTSSALCTIPTGAVCALISPTGQAINWRDDTTAATATAGTGGQALAAGATMWYCGQLANLRMIQQSSAAVVSVSYYK